ARPPSSCPLRAQPNTPSRPPRPKTVPSFAPINPEPTMPTHMVRELTAPGGSAGTGRSGAVERQCDGRKGKAIRSLRWIPRRGVMFSGDARSIRSSRLPETPHDAPDSAMLAARRHAGLRSCHSRAASPRGGRALHVTGLQLVSPGGRLRWTTEPAVGRYRLGVSRGLLG